MDNFFDKALHYLGSKHRNNITALNIGAMDGVMFDEMIGYTNMYGYKVLYVEPIPYLFEKLKNNVLNENALFENAAISDYAGSIQMMTIDKDAIDSGLVHPCFYGMSAVYPPRNGLGSEFDKPTVEKYGKLVNVKCITFDELVEKHNVKNFNILKVDAEGHDYKIFKQVDFTKYSPDVIRLEWINLTEEEQKEITKRLTENNYIYEISMDIVGIKKELYDTLLAQQNTEVVKPVEAIIPSQNNGVTIVTGLWDIGRGDLSEGWSRKFDHYLEKFKDLLRIDENMIIFGDSELRKFVEQNRDSSKTLFVERDLSWFKNNDYYENIQKIRNSSDWYNQAGWLPDSTQAKLKDYNPLVMAKMFLLNDAKILDPFNSEHMYWLDAGITNTVHWGYFTHDKVFNNIKKHVSKFSFVCFPYDAVNEVHGFEYNKLNELAGATVKRVARGGFFGGPKETIENVNNIYYSILISTLAQGYMGTEESIFSIMVYKHNDLINYFDIEGNGLLSTFFENLKNDDLKPKNEGSIVEINNLDVNKVSLYVITFNSPNQFKTLIESFKQYDPDYLNKPRKILLDNSTDLSTYSEYKSLCEYYNFEHIKKDNLGICGGRQFIAEHFEESDSDYMLFFEDDMFFNKKDEFCRNGFRRYEQNLYTKTLQIIKNDNLDFLKLNFTEFFGDNSTQWAWYNVPQHIREQHWPNKTKLPVMGLDPNAPRTNFTSIKSYSNIPYALGEIYYCNWPQIVSKTGNKKMFIETKWAHPYEQTWMSYMFQETIKGNIKGGILLMTPTEHNRFDFYEGSQRKES